MSKISIRFYKDHKVRAVWDEGHNLRAVWDEGHNHWWFSALDIVGAINQQDDHEKNRNYWNYLKAMLRKVKSELVSDTTQLKLKALDGKNITRMPSARLVWTNLQGAQTDKINDREIFMKGIDYSYYYEQEE